MKKPTPEASSAAKAEIVRALYDAAEKDLEELGQSELSLEGPSTAFINFQNVLIKAKQLGDETFALTVETSFKKYIEQFRVVQCDCARNGKDAD